MCGLVRAFMIFDPLLSHYGGQNKSENIWMAEK